MGSRILVVDDEEGLRNIISQVLLDDGHDVTTASSGEAALETYRKTPFPIVMTDVFMDKMTGLDLLHEIRALDPNAQVVIMTSNASLESATEALRLGAYDYLTKPFENLDAISELIERAAEKVELIRQNQTMMNRLKQNTEELEELNERLQNLAIRDGLTGLFNRRYFLEALKTELSRSQRHGHVFSVLFIDLDHFKNYNDTFGHPAGDEVLRTIAELLTKNNRGATIVARYGGEEFILLLPETPKSGAQTFADRLRKCVEQHPFHRENAQPSRHMTLSIGVSTYPEDGADGNALISRADEALYRAKEAGRNRVETADPAAGT